MPLTDHQSQVLSKVYDKCQDLARSNAESAWSIRSWGVAVWAAMIAYGFDKYRPEIVVAAGGVLLCVFFIELAVRQIQYAFIARALEIERTFNDVLVGSSSPVLPSSGASTNIDTPKLKDMFALLAPRRWLIWLPYLLLLSGTAAAYWVLRS